MHTANRFLNDQTFYLYARIIILIMILTILIIIVPRLFVEEHDR